MFELPSVTLDDTPGMQWETGLTASRSEGGSGHIALAGVLFLLIGLKAFTESNLISTDLAEIKISLLNILSIGFISAAFDVGFKVLTSKMAERGVALPGQVEFASAI